MKELLTRFSPDELYILKVAGHLFKITNPYKKDDVGYNQIDAWLFRYMLIKDVSDFSIHNLEWMRRALLKYKRQIQDLGYSYEILRTPVSDKAVFGWKALADSKFLGMDLEIDKDTRFTFKWRDFKDHHVEKVQVKMERAEGIKFLSEHSFKDFAEGITDDTRLKISYLPNPFLVSLLEKLGLGD